MPTRRSTAKSPLRFEVSARFVAGSADESPRQVLTFAFVNTSRETVLVNRYAGRITMLARPEAAFERIDVGDPSARGLPPAAKPTQLVRVAPQGRYSWTEEVTAEHHLPYLGHEGQAWWSQRLRKTPASFRARVCFHNEWPEDPASWVMTALRPFFRPGDVLQDFTACAADVAFEVPVQLEE